MKNKTLPSFLLRFAQGALVGAGSILPGVSGGMLCMAFGLYPALMKLLAAPLETLRAQKRLFIPVISGALTGFFVLARGLERAFERDSAMASCLFLGLVAGSLPPLWIQAGERGRTDRDRRIFRACFSGMLVLSALLKTAPLPAIRPNSGWFFFCGAVWGLSLVLPGLSSSVILIFLGLYQPMTEGIASLDPGCIIPLAAGILLTVLLSAKKVNALLDRRHAAVHHALFGFVCASALMIVPGEYLSPLHCLACILCACAGFLCAMAPEIFCSD